MMLSEALVKSVTAAVPRSGTVLVLGPAHLAEAVSAGRPTAVIWAQPTLRGGRAAQRVGAASPPICCAPRALPLPRARLEAVVMHIAWTARNAARQLDEAGRTLRCGGLVLLVASPPRKMVQGARRLLGRDSALDAEDLTALLLNAGYRDIAQWSPDAGRAYVTSARRRRL